MEQSSFYFDPVSCNVFKNPMWIRLYSIPTVPGHLCLGKNINMEGPSPKCFLCHKLGHRKAILQAVAKLDREQKSLTLL
ncbi:hypothetical protein SUGI_0305330 [Cryptomeria japonica]|nr:hypothetical protein SUGI_0305330 [Cryptomeria japonica]